MKVALVTGAAGFIGHHMVKYLKQRGYYVKGVGIRPSKFTSSPADEFIIGDLLSSEFTSNLFNHHIDEIYHFAADMGGAGYTFSSKNDADIMHNSLLMSLNILNALAKKSLKGVKVFYPSSACVYPEPNQSSPDYPNCIESRAYPAQPESEYGWEKLFSERLYCSYMRNYGIEVNIGRFHTIFGPECVYQGGKEKVPAALARKVALAEDGAEIEIWGNGEQTRSFLYIDDCLNAVYQLVQSDFSGPVNIGSEQLLTINELASKFTSIAGKTLKLKHIDGPIGPCARNSDNQLIREKLGWNPQVSLDDGLKKTFDWIQHQITLSTLRSDN